MFETYEIGLCEEPPDVQKTYVEGLPKDFKGRNGWQSDAKGL